MKNLLFLYRRWFFCPWMFLGLFFSCESVLELEAPSENFVDRQTVFSDVEGAEATARGMYAQMIHSQHTFFTNIGGLNILGGMSSDELTHPSQFYTELLQFEQNLLMADNSMIERAWQSLYRSVYSANLLWEGLNTSGLDEGLVYRLQGEALFVRAFCHFYLVNLFGDIPVVLTKDYQVNANIPRSTMADVYAQIETDLLQARELLDWDYAGERTRPNKGAATALLARAYLFIENWEKAEDMATEVLGQPQHYELVGLEEIVRANNREALWQFHISSMSAEVSTPEGNSFRNMFTSHLFNPLRNDFFDSFEDGDIRKEEWIFQHSSGRFLPNKYKRNVFGGFELPLEYTTVLRLGEVYLIRAEARAHNGDLSGAIADLDVIRGRAGLPLLSDTNPGISQIELLNAIMKERKVELFTEWGHRWLDLKRIGRALDVLSPLKPGFTEDDLLWPIPQKEINNNPALRGHQNPSY
ncbi:RagB/SusD family nutrient uptake outer membrane protein [Sinomicrobium sp. M5D2P9]